ncbi:MAG: hypothetical protein H7Z75_15960 [Ferruginibacter sp.]|nr:hypothetical protein [Cytophagales bacterium]
MRYQINVFLNPDPSGSGPSEPDRQSQAITWEAAVVDVFEAVESYLSTISGEAPFPVGRQEELTTG